VDGTLSSVTGPDPDGGGVLGRVTTSYRYDETNIGTPTAAGTPLTGLKAEYFNGGALNLRPIVTQNDTNIADTWTGAPAAGVNADNFYVRWSGDLVVAAGQNGNWMFSTVATGGTRLIIDGTELINLWGGQTDAAPACSPSINLAAGKHSIVVEYKDSGSGNADVALHAAKATTCSLTDSLIPDPAKNLTFQPAWLNQTSVVAPANTNGGSGRINFSHYASPATQTPDYSLVQSGGSNYITAYSYDSFGRLTQKWMPKGNASRTIDINGNLTGTPDNNYLTTVAYYAPTDIASPDASCTTGPSVNQLGLQKSTTDAGLTTTTSVYNGDGDPLSARNGKGVSCFNYDNQERLASQQDIGGTTTTTTYTYQPDDLVYSATDPTGTVKTDRNEADWPIGSTDTYGSRLIYKFDQEGNPIVESRFFTSFGGLNSINNTFNEGDQLTSETDYNHRAYSFFYNTRGALVGVNYPTSTATFSYKTIDPAGWLDSVVNRHGTLTSPVGKATGSAPTSAPADSSPLGDYTYTYFQDGQRLTEAAKLGTAAVQTTTYAYDPIGRLQTVNFPDATSRRYCFDLDSNRTRWNTSTTGDCTTGTAGATYSYSATKLDQLSSVTQGTAVTNYAYNGDGDTTGRNTDTLTYDVRDRLSGATVAGRTVSYEYDPAGFMHKRSVLTSYLGAVLESQPADYWRLDETTGTSATDRIAGKNGTYTGGYTLNQTGALTASGDSDPAITLNGTTGWVTTPVTLSTAQLAHFSLETWINFAAAPASTVTIAGVNSSIKLQLTHTRGVQASYVDGVGTTHTLAGPNGSLTTGAWHHVVMIYDGSQLRVWVDGFQSNTVFPAPAGNANTLSIGRTSGNSDWFTGQIDDVSLYTRALTAGEVQNHHTRGLNTPNTTSVYYRFGGSVETADPSTNPSVTDIDTNAPDGTDLAHDTEDPLSLAQATNFLYYNGHGDLAIETDNTGTVTATHSYDPFGAALDTTAGNNTTVAAAGGTERYAASWDKKTDISTSLVQMGARPYDPTTGRFYSTDPVPGGSLNNYDYAGQDPLNGYDLTGLETDGNRNWTDGNEEGGSGETEAQAWARAANEPIVGLGYSVNDALKNPEETIGGTLGSDASKLFDELRMEGWTVGENAEGTGIRAIDGKGRSIILEENVDRAGDKIHPDLPDWYWRVSTGRGPVQRFPRR
jgi:RHS repeat-associated protein